jgi:hypothetical protein
MEYIETHLKPLYEAGFSLDLSNDLANDKYLNVGVRNPGDFFQQVVLGPSNGAILKFEYYNGDECPSIEGISFSIIEEAIGITKIDSIYRGFNYQIHRSYETFPSDLIYPSIILPEVLDNLKYQIHDKKLNDQLIGALDNVMDGIKEKDKKWWRPKMSDEKAHRIFSRQLMGIIEGIKILKKFE